MNFSIIFGNFLYQYFPPLYTKAYSIFKKNQDKNEIAFLKQHIKAGHHVLDIGANIGFYTRILSNIVGSIGRVHAFEPDKNNFNYLKKNTASISNVLLNNMAVGSSTGTIQIYTSDELNVDHRTYPVDNYKNSYDVSVIRIDDYMLDKGEIHFIKMDIQGYEIEAIRGMKKLLDTYHPKILLEFWPHGIEAAGNKVSDYFDQLNQFGYKIQLLENGTIKEIDLHQIAKFNGLPKEQYFNIFLN